MLTMFLDDNLNSSCLENYRYHNSTYCKIIGRFTIDTEVNEEEIEKQRVEDKDYEPTLVYGSIDDRFFLNNNDTKDKFNSNQNDVDI
ncbi:hypothetical protein V1477_016494 [Vespula maculifrons]|uniref:Uncharacterized protein n=1 Tax=Vespula maculifrons TaxID=7453 RepID=A0ABD2B9C7_VESMC